MTLSECIYILGVAHIRYLLGSWKYRLEKAIQAAYDADDLDALRAYRELRYIPIARIEIEIN